ncbi:hypothetical protein C2E25_00625 [Geothermobacter hydrogeniphilus]|uniref:precorrin-2 dehydrogenase n=2 Tax=Geothermobacter hydrogeniphilus TaxID=1969733 RepID=A0A2K2HEP8_9BACT|nr:hypothetical protein C2E25_00625 [Geothermobacter hydrogeniphilus]
MPRFRWRVTRSARSPFSVRPGPAGTAPRLISSLNWKPTIPVNWQKPLCFLADCCANWLNTNCLESDLMSLFPAMLDLQDRLCLVFGGGTVACRKLQSLLAAGARVRLVAPDCRRPPARGEFEWLRRCWRPEDLSPDILLVVVATDNPRVNREIAETARRMNILVNAAAVGARGDLQFPAVRRRGRLTLAVGTEGGSPALAGLVADLALQRFGSEWEFVAELAAALRRSALTAASGQEYNQSFLRLLLDGGLAELVARGRWNDVDQLLQTVCGGNCSLAALGLERPDGNP